MVQTTDARGKTISYTYDALNRKTGEYDAPVGSQSASNQLASWVYDNSNNAVPGMTDPIGHLTTETSYSGGAAYIEQQSGFNVFGESLGETVTIPSTEGALAGSYKFSHVYTGTTGLPLKDNYPQAGGLPAETVLRGYATNLDLPTTLNGLTGYAQGVTYDAYGRVNQETIGASPDLAYITDTYDPHTGNLTDQLVTRAVATACEPWTRRPTAYDLAGNITVPDQHPAGLGEHLRDPVLHLRPARPADRGLDRHRQLRQPSPRRRTRAMVGDNLGASSAYWTTWSYDAVGNRTSQVQHATSGGTDTTTSYSYNGNEAGQPGTLTGTNTTGGSTGSTSYGYDAAGNMTSATPARATRP